MTQRKNLKKITKTPSVFRVKMVYNSVIQRWVTQTNKQEVQTMNTSNNKKNCESSNKNNTRKEQWKDIAGFDGKYQVSNKGRVRTSDG